MDQKRHLCKVWIEKMDNQRYPFMPGRLVVTCTCCCICYLTYPVSGTSQAYVLNVTPRDMLKPRALGPVNVIYLEMGSLQIWSSKMKSHWIWVLFNNTDILISRATDKQGRRMCENGGRVWSEAAISQGMSRNIKEARRSKLRFLL